jgi:hypothetical protein
MVLEERYNGLPSKLRVLRQPAVFPTGHPFMGANPKSPVVRGQQAEEMLTRWRLPRDGPNAVEAKQTEFRSEPEVAVRRLSNCPDPAFKKALANFP